MAHKQVSFRSAAREMAMGATQFAGAVRVA